MNDDINDDNMRNEHRLSEQEFCFVYFFTHVLHRLPRNLRPLRGQQPRCDSPADGTGTSPVYYKINEDK